MKRVTFGPEHEDFRDSAAKTTRDVVLLDGQDCVGLLRGAPNYRRIERLDRVHVDDPHRCPLASERSGRIERRP